MSFAAAVQIVDDDGKKKKKNGVGEVPSGKLPRRKMEKLARRGMERLDVVDGVMIVADVGVDVDVEEREDGKKDDDGGIWLGRAQMPDSIP